jgi:hypothetical protein
VESVAVSTPQQNGTSHYIVYAGTTNGGVWRTDDIKDGTFQYTVITFPQIGPLPPPPPRTIWLDPTANPGGIHWRSLTDQQPSLATSAMALDPTDTSGNTLWVGTGDFGSFASASQFGPTMGLLLTRDGGQTWNVMGQAALGNSRIASVVPTGVQNVTSTPGGLTIDNGETILVAAFDGGGIFRSTDGGATFQLAFNQDNATPSNPNGTPLSGTATDLVADPNNIHRYFAAMVGAGVAGIYQSTDDGAHWSRIDNSGILTGISSSNISSAEMIRLAVHADSSGTVLFVGIMDNPPAPAPGSPPPAPGAPTNATLAGISSATIPASGKPSWGFLAPPSSPTVFHFQGVTQLFALAADPTSATTVYVSGQGSGNTAVIFRGDVSQGTSSWVNLQGGSTNGTQPHTDSRHLFFLNNTTLLETDDGGIFGLTNPSQASTADTYDRWIDLVGDLHNTEFFSATYDTNNGVLLGGTQDNGTPLQTANSSNWNDFFGGDGGFVGMARDSTVFDPQAITDQIYLGSDDGFSGFTRYYVQSQKTQQVQLASARGAAAFSGLNNTRSQPGQPTDQQLGGQSTDLPFPFAVSQQDDQKLLLGYNGVYESVESDSTGFIAPGDVINDITPTAMTGVVTSLDYTGPQALVGTNTGQVWLRTTAGVSFSLLTPPAPGGGVRKVLFDPRTTNTLYVLYSNGNIWQVTNAGSASPSWFELDGSDINAPGQLSRLSPDIRTLAIYSPPSGNEVLLAGGLGGVYRKFLGSSDTAWRTYGKGLPNAVVTDLSYAPLNSNGNGDTLVAATFGRGIWTLANASATLTKPATLQIDDDRGANNVIDVRIDPNNSTFLQVTVNGNVEYDKPYAYFSTIAINANRFQDQVFVEDAPVATQVQVTSGQLGSVTVGKNGTLQGIVGDVNVSDPNDFAALTIDDSADASNHVTVPVTITNSKVTGLSVGTISYDQAGLSNLDINVAFNSFAFPTEVFNVLSTPNYSSILPGLTTTRLVTGGADTVNVGKSRNVSGIAGTLFIGNDGLDLGTFVQVDDSLDPVAQTSVQFERFTDPGTSLLYQAIENLAPANIYLADGDVQSATVLLGAPVTGHNAVTVVDTVPEGAAPYLTLEGGTQAGSGGPGNDTLAIRGTTTSVLAQNFATVSIGNATDGVQDIHGDVTVTNAGPLTSLTVDDSADQTGRTATFGVETASAPGTLLGITGLAPGATINYSPFSLASLTIDGGSGGNVFTVVNTAVNSAFPTLTTVLNTQDSTATDEVDIQVTTGPLQVNGLAGALRVKVGNATDGVQDIHGNVTVTNAGPLTSLTVDDSADQTGRTATLGVETASAPGTLLGITGLAPGATINYSPFGLASLTIDGGSGGNVFTVVNTAVNSAFPTLNTLTTVLNTQDSTATDEVDIQVTTGPLQVNGLAGALRVKVGNATAGVQDIHGDVTVTNAGPFTSLTVDDSADQTGRTATLGVETGIVPITLLGITGLAPGATINYSPFSLASLTIDGGSGGNVFTVVNTAVNSPFPTLNTLTTVLNTQDSTATDEVDIQGTTGPLQVKDLAGGLRVNVGSAANTFDPIQGTIAIQGAGGNTSLTVTDQGTTTSQQWDVASSFIDRYSFPGSRPTVPQITYDNVGMVTVTAGSAQDFIVVQSTDRRTTTVVNGGGGNGDYFTVENFSNSLDQLQGVLQTHDVTPYNLLITDGGTQARHDYLLTTGQLVRDGIAPITFDSDVALVLDASAGGGTVNVPSYAGNGVAAIAVVSADNVTIGNSSAGLSGITADVRVQAMAGQTPHVLLDDSANQSGRTFDLGSDPFFGYLVNGHMDPIRGRIGLLLDPAAPVTLKTGNLDDSFQVHDLVGMPTLTLDGGGGNNTLNINDQGTSSQQEYILNATQVLRYPIPPSANPPATINYFNVSSLNVYGSSAFDTWIVRSTLKGTTTALYSDTPAGTTGANAFLVGDSNNPLDGIQGPLALHGASIYDYAVDYDYLNPSAHTYTLSTPNPTTTLLQRDGMAAITHDGIGELVLYVAVVGGNHLNVQGVPANLLATLSASNGDQDVVGSLAPTSQGGTMSAILGEVGIGFEANTVTAPVRVTLDDSGDNTTAPRRVTMGSLALNPSITVPLITNLAGNGEQVYWRDLPSGSSVTVNGRAGGNETFAMQSLPSTQVPPTINAGGSNNTLQGPDTANTWQITGANAGTLNGTVAFAGVQNLTGGAANDTFQFHTGGSLAGSINGGGGTNTLDYTAYQGNILVDLLLHTASLVGQGVSNVANVNGSNGNSLIVGDANANVLVGGTGRNVIIGDVGSDKITGGAGFNLLIGGITSYDTTPAALQALQVYWDNPNVTTLDGLVNPLKKGVTVNGQFLVVNKTTVQNDNAPDSLISSGGPTWFIADKDDTLDNGTPIRKIDRLLLI